VIILREIAVAGVSRGGHGDGMMADSNFAERLPAWMAQSHVFLGAELSQGGDLLGRAMVRMCSDILIAGFCAFRRWAEPRSMPCREKAHRLRFRVGAPSPL
jgi:hypothetical protein